MGIILKEDNVISLRTGFVRVNERRNIVTFSLSPTEAEICTKTSIPEDNLSRSPNLDWVSKDHVYLYRQMRSPSEELKLMQGPPNWEQQLKPLKFVKKPEFQLVWSDSGNSVSLYLNGEPWAFIYEGTRSGYSKGILAPINPRFHIITNLWDQDLFKKIFIDK